MNQDLQDEIESINAIYSPSTLQVITSTPPAPTICALLLPTHHQIALRLSFDHSYPDSPPSILGTESVGPDVPKGLGQQVVLLSRNVLGEIYSPGAACIFDLVEETTARLSSLNPDASSPTRSSAVDTAQSSGDYALPPDHPDRHSDAPAQDPVPGPAPTWTLSEPVSEKKSVFLARAAPVRSVAEAKGCIAHLLATDKKAAKASHNMTAWRIRGGDDNGDAGPSSRGGGGVVYQDCDDDGETAAGARLLHLLTVMGAWDVVVVVSRWYGGVHLGPDRFRIINAVAREALVGLLGDDAAVGTGKGTGRGRQGKK